MGAEGNDRERELEQRLARLEARLRRLEGAAGIDPAVHPQAGAPTKPAEPVVSAWQTNKPALPTATSAGPGGPSPGRVKREPPLRIPSDVKREPLFRIPSGIKLPNFSWSLEDIEARLTGRTLAWVGGLALVLGAIFFLSLAFTRGWIGPELRVLIGLVAGSSALGGGAALLERRNRLIGLVLTAVGLAIISVSLVGATRLYDLVPVELGLVAALLTALVAALIAVRANSQIVAALGLVSVLAAPPLMGAKPDMATLGFVAVVLVATTGVALWRSWWWLPTAAFVLSAPQAATWVMSDPDPVFGLVGIGLFWTLNIVAAGGEEFRRHRDDLSPSSATLLLANVAFFVWAGFELLTGDLVVYRGFLLVLVALAQFGVGGYFVVRDGDRNLFGLLAMGTGIAALTMAAPVQLGASAVPVAWSAEAVALAWVAVRRGHPYSALVTAILYGLAGAYLLGLYGRPIASTTGVPFVDGPGASLAFFAAAVAIGVWIVRDRELRSVLAAFGLLVVALCAPTVLNAPLTAIAMSILMVVATAVWRALPVLPGQPIAWQVKGLIPRTLQTIGPWRSRANAALPLVAGLLGLQATGSVVGRLYGSTATYVASVVPFVDPAGAALAVYLLALGAVAWISGRSRLREPLAAVGLLVTARACLVELDGVALVAAWSTLTVIGLAIWRGLATLPHEAPIAISPRLNPALTLDRTLPLASLVTGLLAVAHVLEVELPIDVFGRVIPPVVPFTNDGAVAAMVLIAAALASGAAVGGALARRVSVLVAGGVAAYAIPFEVYAWAVVVLWIGLGGLALVMARVDRAGRSVYLVADAAMVIGAAVVAAGIVARPARLVVGASAIDPVVALQSVAALGAVVIGLVGLARANRSQPWARWIWRAAGVATLYLLSVAVVDLVGTQVGGSVGTDELRTQGQVALSVLWAVLGVIAFVAGLRLRIDDLRRGGLALLTLATAKVFLFDLSALDVAYRVISLIVLGLLLLASAWIWQRFQPRSPAPGEGHGG